MMSTSVVDVGLFSSPKTPCAQVMIRLGDYIKAVPLISTPDKTAQFAYLKLNDHPEFVNEGARLIAGHVKTAGYKQPYFVTAEASTLALAHVLRSQYGIDGITLYKTAQLNDVDPISVTYSAITSRSAQNLFLGKNRMQELLQAEEVIILYSICTSGSTIKAIYDLLMKAGVSADKIKEAVVLFTEGEPKKALDVGRDASLKIHSFSNMPLIITEAIAPRLK